MPAADSARRLAWRSRFRWLPCWPPSPSCIPALASLFGWARIAAAAWALLYQAPSLDPTIRDKIDTADQVAGILHNTRSNGRAENNYGRP